MKINDASRSAAVARRPASGQRGKGFVADAGRPADAGATLPVSPLAAPDAILSLQEVAADRAGGQRAVERAHDLLDELEKLRLAMVDGRTSGAALGRLATLVHDPGATGAGDPRLDGILQEVEVRAAVEVAKREGDDPPDGEM